MPRQLEKLPPTLRRFSTACGPFSCAGKSTRVRRVLRPHPRHSTFSPGIPSKTRGQSTASIEPGSNPVPRCAEQWPMSVMFRTSRPLFPLLEIDVESTLRLCTGSAGRCGLICSVALQTRGQKYERRVPLY